MTIRKRIHIDELEYTKEGLRTREPIPLTVGEHNQVVLVRPERVRAVPVGFGAFDTDSCFPTPGALATGLRVSLEQLARHVDGGPDTSIYQFFGHAEPSGDDAHNKSLSDRRAEVIRAFFVADVDAVLAIAQSEEWSTREQQVMLRMLKCDPGAIDGELGPVTEDAVRLFQHEYSDGIFHRHLPGRPDVAPLPDDGQLQGATAAALIEAYVQATSPQLDPAQVHPTHPTVGCSEFNQAVLETPAYNRRICLVVYEQLPPFHDRAPCMAGDHTVCPIDDRDEHSRCLWYREHVIDPRLSELVHLHTDLRWMVLPNGKILLSALTTLCEGESISFQVYRTNPISVQDTVTAEVLGEQLSGELSGIIRGSVAQVVWDPPSDFDLFESGLVPFTIEQLMARDTANTRARIPVFRVWGGGSESISPPPGRELGRTPRDPRNLDESSQLGFVGIDWWGSVFQHATAEEERTGTTLHPLVHDEPRIRSKRHATEKLEPHANTETR